MNDRLSFIRSKTLLLGIGLLVAVLILVARWTSLSRVVDHASFEGLRPETRIATVQDVPSHRPHILGDAIPPTLRSSEELLPRSFVIRLEALIKEPDAARREEMLEGLVQDVGGSDIREWLSFLKDKEPSELIDTLSLRLIRRWTEANPQAAADWVIGDSPDHLRSDALDHVAVVWSAQSFGDVTDWARQLPEENLKASVMIKVAYELVRTEPLEALRLASEVPPDKGRDDFIEHALKQWATSAPDEAAGWATQLENSSLRQRAMASIASTWGETDPFAAATLAMNSITPGRTQDDTVVGIVQRWAQQSPDKAAAWVIAFPPGHLQDTATTELVKLWADQNIEEPGQWLQGLSSGSVRDLAIQAYVAKLEPKFPELAKLWTLKLGDDSLRTSSPELEDSK